MKISARVQKILASRQTTAKFPFLIKISHPDFNDMFYINSSDNFLFQGNIYNASSFAIEPPDQDGAKVGNASLTISAVDQAWIQRIREIQKPAQLQFTAVIIYDEYGEIAGIEPLEENIFTCRAAKWNEISITWDLSFDERMGCIITSVKCTPINVPGCA